MKLTAYVKPGYPLDIRPAPVERQWMDETPHRGAYRCLPLDIANTYGWELLCQEDFSATWDGRNSVDAVSISSSNTDPVGTSHFGSGVLTFRVPCIFITDPEFDLMVQGPMNRFKDGIAPLSAVVETDWVPTPFTMNWKFTRAGFPVHFVKGEPFCHIFPVARNFIESVDPEIRPISSNPNLERRNEAWKASRNAFIKKLRTGETPKVNEQWQKFYITRQEPAPAEGGVISTHRTKVNLKPFRKPTTEIQS